MEIRFVSSLTPEDEARVAQMLVAMARIWLDQLPLAYNIHITTSVGLVVACNSATSDDDPPFGDEPPARRH